MRRCRGCGGSLDSILDLGPLAISTFPLPGEGAERAPIHLCACASCRLVQLAESVDPDRIFRHYWYRSGVNEVMVAELSDIAQRAVRFVGDLEPGEVVIDIGANDGTLLGCLPDHLLKVAFEPAHNLNESLHHYAHLTAADYWPRGLGQLQLGQASIITSIACFYDVDDPHAFIQAVADHLAPGGVWIVQLQDLAQMIEATAFDNLCHEHVAYYSLRSVEALLARHRLALVDAERRAINGGSLRLYIQHANRPHRLEGQRRVQALRAAEDGCDAWQTLETFAWKVGEMRKQITAVVDVLAHNGKVIDLYAASTKANTLLQYCGLGGEVIRQAWERSPEKWGRQTVTGIPIVSEELGRLRPPDALLVGAWQFAEAFQAREAEYLARGGSMILPLPHCEVVQGGAGV